MASVRRYWLVCCVFLLWSGLSMAQEGGGGTLYLPGMPLPPSNASSSSDAGAADAGSKGATAHRGGKVSQVRVAGGGTKIDRSIVRRNEPLVYRGVVPPSQDTAPNSERLAKSKQGVNALTWLGFQRRGCTDVVFLQLKDRGEYERVEQRGDTLTLRIRNTVLTARNTSRELDLRYFKSPILRADARRSGKDVVVRIRFEKPIPYDIKWVGQFIEISVQGVDCKP